MNSFYGLLSTKEIGTPSPSGKFITVPFFTGCIYAAYPTKDSENVNIIDYNICSTNKKITCLMIGWYGHLIQRKASWTYIPWKMLPCLWHQGNKIELSFLNDIWYCLAFYQTWNIIWVSWRSSDMDRTYWELWWTN